MPRRVRHRRGAGGAAGNDQHLGLGDAMTAFAYRSPQHAAVVAATPQQNWYAEELFTRFALLAATGTIDGAAVA